MPDITMCPGLTCPLKEKCVRYKSKPSERQVYFTTPPFDPSTGQCKQFWPEK